MDEKELSTLHFASNNTPTLNQKACKITQFPKPTLVELLSEIGIEITNGKGWQIQFAEFKKQFNNTL